MSNNKNSLPVQPEYSFISNGTKIKGDIETKQDFRIDGELVGIIKCEKRVITGKDSVIKGSIISEDSVVSGYVEGSITTSKSLTLESTSKVNCDISTSTLIIEPGTIFNGNCVMKNKASELAVDSKHGKKK